MILSGKEIARRMGKEIFIDPFRPEQLNPNSYNLTLHNELLIYENRELDMKILNPSSTGRLGLFIHVSAGFGDIGFAGCWTLEIFCVQPVRIYPNVEICQIYFHDILGEYELYSSGKYQNSREILPSRMYQEDIFQEGFHQKMKSPQ